MPNILFTDKCNLKCPYCFAQDEMNGTTSFDLLDIKDFVKYIKWCEKKDCLKILGGEPLLHPQYDKFVRLAFINGYKRVLVFTNGILLDKFYDLSKKGNLIYTVNFNSRENMGNEKYEKMCENILNYPKKEQLCLGINLYKPDLDLTEYIKMIEKAKLKMVRIGIAVLNEKVAVNTDMFEYYSSMKPLLMKILKYSLENHLNISLDCNNIPYCLYTEEEKEYFNKFNSEYLTYNTCGNVCDVFIDNTSSHCFTTSNFDKRNIYDFKSENDLHCFYSEKYKDISKKIIRLEKCKTCEYLNTKKCAGGCLSFYTNEIKKYI